MEMRRCVKGHYYDASVNSDCPYCNSVSDSGKTVALGAVPDSNMGKTVPLGMVSAPVAPQPGPVMGDDSKTVPLGYNTGLAGAASGPMFTPQADDDNDRTIAVVHKDTGIDPVVGWLVSVSGKEKGRDYRIHSDNNYIGRSEKMDICVHGDETISRENHAVVSYDTIDKIFYFSPGDGRNIVRHNGKAIFQTVELAAYDKVVVGKTELIFMPLCGKQFEWSQKDDI